MFHDFIEPGVPPAVFWVFVGVAIIIQGITLLSQRLNRAIPKGLEIA